MLKHSRTFLGDFKLLAFSTIEPHWFSQIFCFQDGTFAFSDFVTAFEEYEVQRVVRSYENSISIHVNCCQQGDWSQVYYVYQSSL